MDLTINGMSCDPGVFRITLPGYDAARTESIDEARSGRSLVLTIPRTPRNNKALGFAAETDSADRFNERDCVAELSQDGALLIGGKVRLLAVEKEGYRIEIRHGKARWAENASRRQLDELAISWKARLTPTTIYQSWTDDSCVRFFPIHRDEYEQKNSSTDLLPAERILAVEDYHPFLHLASLIERIFAESNYRVKSRLFQTDLFRSLYISGAYASHDTTALVNRMGFLARRIAPAAAAGNELGRVAANPKALANSVGNIVDTATPLSVDDDGTVLTELYNNGNCFSKVNGKIVFTPPTTITAGFEYYLKYTTDHRILSRTRLTGLDTIYLGPGAEFGFELANRYEDQRDKLAANFSYRVIVFNHQDGNRYRLNYTRNGLAGIVWTSFSGRSALVTTPATGTFSDPRLEVYNGTGWSAYREDWALYKGYIEESGQTTVEVRLRTPAETISPDAPKYFDQIYFAGAGEGMVLTLHKECSLRPTFLAGAAYGSQLAFSDVARLGIRQSELIEAVAHLFNLRFFTEEETRTVWIDPEADLFGSGDPVDWSRRTDFSKPIVRRLTDTEIHEVRTWKFQDGDGAVTRFDNDQETTLGAWSFRSASRATLQGEEVNRNPLFAPSVSSVGHYLNAPSARIIQVGDRDKAAEEGVNFSPRIVSYAGLKRLPDNERWGYPSGKNEYPLIAFLYPGDEETQPFTLGFEDRNGASGLHRYYDRQLSREDTGERISITLHIRPIEFEALFAPGTGIADFRSAYRINVGTGIVTAALRSIEEYDALAELATCVFERIDTSRR